MKDLAEAYLAKAQENAIRFKDINFFNGPLYQENDIKAAFNAGRESVVDSMPELEWEECVGGFINKDQFRNWYIEINEYAKQKYTLVIPGDIPRCFITLKEAKQAANEDYKKRIKQALGL
jgi:hypothetical protein